MSLPLRKARGFTLIELLVVLVIIGVLAMVGVVMVGNRPAASVRAVMDEIEGVISNAHKRAGATGADVVITTQGAWDPTNPLVLAFTGAQPSEVFRLAVTPGPPPVLQRVHMHAGVVTVAQRAWWAAGSVGSEDITAIAPFNAPAGDTARSGFRNILDDDTRNIFKGGGAVEAARVSGVNKRFTETFWVEIVSLRDGQPFAGGARGLLVGLANGGTIYKFYNPGTMNGGDGRWRRI